MKPAAHTTVVAYLRVSTDDQALGLEAQRHSIEGWAKQRGLTVRSWHTDEGVHGDSEIGARPGLSAALEDLQSGENMVVMRRDRLARDVVVAALVGRTLKLQGSQVLTVDGLGDISGPEGQLVTGLMDLIAQYERFLISARTKAALARKRARGERTGTVPLGYRMSLGMMVPDKAEREAAMRIRELVEQGESYRSICHTLKAEGFKPRGDEWYPMTVRRIALREPSW